MSPLQICFVSDHPRRRFFRRDASFIYRCENLGLALQAMGHDVRLLHLNELLLRPGRPDVAVFLRPSLSWRMRWALATLRRRRCRVVADTDDLNFDPAMAAYRPSVLAGTAGLHKTERKFARALAALAAFDAVTVSTDELQRRLQAVLPQMRCAVIPNAVHRSWRLLQLPPASRRVITYFSGTGTHDRDFALVAPALRQLLDEEPDLAVQVVGRLNTPLQHARLERVGKLPFADYPAAVAASWLNIAPLEDTPFTRGKSALKTIEAGFFGVPTVATPLGDTLRLQGPGVLFAQTEADWLQQLRRAVQPAERARLADGLAARLQPLSDIDVFAAQWLRFVTG